MIYERLRIGLGAVGSGRIVEMQGLMPDKGVMMPRRGGVILLGLLLRETCIWEGSVWEAGIREGRIAEARIGIIRVGVCLLRVARGLRGLGREDPVCKARVLEGA